jgi:hypothetical protein
MAINRLFSAFLLLLCAVHSRGQSAFESAVAAAELEMGLRNMYHTVVWDMSPLMPYQFDQEKARVTYSLGEKGVEVTAVPKVLGTFDLKDKTFLWADQNPSIDRKLSDRAAVFRQSMPAAYQKAKFRASPETGLALLPLFGVHLDANATDIKRQDDTVIYFALMEVEIAEAGQKPRTILPKNHVFLQQDEAILDLVREFLGKKCAISKLYYGEKLDVEKADKQMVDVHLQYWSNEDPFFFPALSSPCADDPEKILAWQVFAMDGGRKFVMFVNDLGYSKEFRAYEIDPKATGKKLIVQEY